MSYEIDHYCPECLCSFCKFRDLWLGQLLVGGSYGSYGKADPLQVYAGWNRNP